jgi:site-specific DNA recombinase
MTVTTLPIGLYARISDDVAGNAAGVGRQEEDGRTLADLRRWAVAEVYVDNDLSAFKTNVVRPAFERMLLDLADGKIDGIVAYDLDRFARQPVDLERAIRIYDDREKAGRPARFATVQGDIDLQSADGRTMARVMVAFANKSSMDTSRRVKRKHLELARQGVPVGGNRPFGYQRDKVTIEPSEAALIVEAAEQIIGGAALHEVVRRWNAAGVTTTRGNPWQRSVLKNMLRSPRLAGYRVHQGGIATHADGSPVTGQHPAILDEATWERLCAVLNDPKRGSSKARPGGRRYLLSGVVRCAKCRSLLRGNADARWGTFRYACPSPTSGGCGKVAITGPHIDDYVAGFTREALAEMGVERSMVSSWERDNELERVLAEIAGTMAAISAGELPSKVGYAHVTDLHAREEELRAEREAWVRSHVAAAAVPDHPAQDWDRLDLDRQRGLVELVVEALYIKPSAARGRRGFDDSRVELVERRAPAPHLRG